MADPTPPTSPNSVTLDAPATLFDEAAAAVPAFQFFEGSNCGISRETQCLLRTRLKKSALILFAGFAVFLLWNAWNANIESNPHAWRILFAHAAVTAILGAATMTLCRGCEIGLTRLRIYEIIVFGAPAAFFTFLQFSTMDIACGVVMEVVPQLASAAGRASVHRLALQSPALNWVFLIFTYALFIPNTFRRAAVVLGAMGLAPLATAAFAWSSCPHVGFVMGLHPEFLTYLVLMMTFAVGVGLAGVRTIGNLRTEAFTARQLGQYRLLEKIGSGGMGEVYLAEHQFMKRPCAIKVIRPEKAGDPHVLARFEREVDATAKLSHWNSIEIFDYGRTDDGTFYYVMEYLPGMSLQQIVDQTGAMPPSRVVHFLLQTCAALQEAHDMGLLHRDIKPANIFAAHRGGLHDVAKLLDFGLVKPAAEMESSRLTMEGAITGSPQYMAPEQAILDENADSRADIYALGVVAYHLLAGEPPFDYDQPLKVLMAHAHERPRPLSEIQDGIPPELEKIVMRCLEKKPADRFQSAAELAAALAATQRADAWTADDAAQWWRTQNASAEQVVVETA